MELTGVPLRRVLLLLAGCLMTNIVLAQVPTAPDDFYIVRHDGQNELNWSANPGAENVLNYKVYRSLDKTNFIEVATVPSSLMPQYLDNNVRNGLTYFYQLTASNAAGEGPPSVVDASVPGIDFGKFMEFRGINHKDSLAIFNSDELQLANQSFTIELWLRIKRLPLSANEAHLVSRFRAPGQPNYEAFCLRVLNSGQLEFRTRGASTSISTTEVLGENDWYHVALTYQEDTGSPFVNPNDVSIYINGQLTTVTPGPGPGVIIDPPPSPGGSLVIGGDATSSPNYFEGYISELRIWDGVKTGFEIAGDRCTMFRGDEAGLLGLWRFNEKSTSAPLVYDYSPNGNNGGDTDVRIVDFKPQATDDIGIAVENTTYNISIQDNDAGFSRKPLVATLLPGYPLSGNATLIDNDSTISYVPAPGFFGIDSLMYFLSDTSVVCNSIPEKDTAAVLVLVQCSNKDTLDWNNRAAKDMGGQQLVQEGLVVDFQVDDPENIQTGFANENGFQNTNSVVWKQDAASNLQAGTAWMLFNRPVDQFCLDLLDVDASPGAFIDSVVVNGYRNGNVVQLMPFNVTTGAAVDFGGINSFTGNGPADDVTGDEGNVSVCFFTPVDSVQIIFTNAQLAPANPAEQGLGIGNLTWCAFPNNAPAVRNDMGAEVDSLHFAIAPDSLLNICLNVSDVDVDSVFIASFGALSQGGVATTTNPGAICINYEAATGFEGVETFSVLVCDDRANQLCDEVIISVRTGSSPPPPPPPPPDPPAEPVIFISQALSPNGDRILDHWELTGIEEFPNCVIKVFNIWGDLIFQQTGYNNQSRAWWGQTTEGNTIGGSVAPDGTYFYMIEPGEGQQLMKGYVVLKR